VTKNQQLPLVPTKEPRLLRLLWNSVKASPLAKKIAAERGVQLEGVSGTGPGGRVVAADVPEKGSAPRRIVRSGHRQGRAHQAGEGDTRVPLFQHAQDHRGAPAREQIAEPHFYLTSRSTPVPHAIRKELNSANEAAQLPRFPSTISSSWPSPAPPRRILM